MPSDTERVGRALTELGSGSTAFDVRFRPVYKDSPLVVETIRRALAGEDQQSMTVSIGSLHFFFFENFYLSLRSQTCRVSSNTQAFERRGCTRFRLRLHERSRNERASRRIHP